MSSKAFFVSIVFLFLLSFSTNGALKGIVMDKSTDVPVEGAIVKIKNKGVSDTTDTEGKFEFVLSVSVNPNRLSNSFHLKPSYNPSKGIIFANKAKGNVRVDVFSLNGRLVSTLVNSVLEQGIWSWPINNMPKGTYLARIKSSGETNSFIFTLLESNFRSGIAQKMVCSINYYNPSNTIAAVSIDTIITTKPGYCADTLLWTEKVNDSITIYLQDTTVTTPEPSNRITIPFDRNWVFYRGNADGAEKSDFADDSWRALNVPHDWSIEGPYSSSNSTGAAGGFLPAGIGWYRKHFSNLSNSYSGKRIYIEFDGVMANATAYVNGKLLGTHNYGYTCFRYDITSQVNLGGDNVISVKVDNSVQPASRWYTGAGIYRHVRLIITDAVHIGKWETFVTTPTANSINVKTVVVNESSSAHDVHLKAVVVDPDGLQLPPVNAAAKSISPGKSAEYSIDIPVSGAKLWSLETPNMYKVILTVLEGNTVLDNEETPFGIRTIKYDALNGFTLNGKSIKHKGVCLHHDMSGLGAAVPLRAMQRRLAILKTMGVNAIRTAHNPVAPDVLDLFDRMGFLVMDEFFDAWVAHKERGDYASFFKNNYKSDVTDIVIRDRNHPSIVMYSIGNEIRDGLSTRTTYAKDMVSICHSLDPTRPVTQALFRPQINGDYPGATVNVLDIFGVNYRNTELLEAVQGTSKTGVSTEMGMKPSLWNDFYMKHPQMIGTYLWTGADYLGEAGSWPAIGNGSGLIDRVGTIKDIGYQYQAVWSKTTTNKPKTSTAAPVKIVLTVDHPTITTDWDDVAYVKATLVDESGNIAVNASNNVTFSSSGSAGSIIAVDNGSNEAESYRGTSRKAYKGICFAIVQMEAAGTINITAFSNGLTEASVMVSGEDASFVPCSDDCD